MLPFKDLKSPYKDENSLPEIKFQDNEEIIFSNYKISAFDEGHTTMESKTCVLLLYFN